LEERGISFEAVHLGDELTMQGVRAAAGAATVPQIFIGGRLIGDSQKLSEYLATTDNEHLATSA
jgi:glutaredoxin